MNISDTDLAILNFDETFAIAARDLFAANGLEQIFSVPGDQQQTAETSGEILFETGGASNKGFVPAYVQADAASDGIVDDYYTGTLTLTLRTPREIPTPAITAGVLTRHNEICARLRALLQTHRNPFDAYLTHYAVKFIRPVSTRHYADLDFMQDVSQLVFQVEWSILPESWEP